MKLVTIFMCITVSFASSPNVKMQLSVNHLQMILTCSVQERNSELNIYLECPFGKICKENCKKTCFAQSKECLSDKMIQCIDHGFDKITNWYVIQYIIDATDPLNNGNWKCSYSGQESESIKVAVPSNLSTTTKISKFTKSTVPEIPQSEYISNNVKKEPTKPSGNEGMKPSLGYSKLLTKSEFILSVIGLLAVSLIFNVFFCSRLIFIKCKLKKTQYTNGNYFSIPPNQTNFNRCNSQVSDPERIYEDTSTTQRQMSFMTKIKNSNGNYVGQNTLTPSSGPSTLLPPNFLPLNPSLSFSGPLSDNGTQLMNTPPQIYYPFPIDSTQVNYSDNNINSDNQYTNFVSVQPDGNQRRDTYNQPLYLAFTPAHQFIPSNGRYLQYSHQPLQMTTESSNSSNPKSSPINSQIKNGLVSRSNSEQDNYKISREMMEEADNLLRTADNLLKSTQKEMNMIQ